MSFISLRLSHIPHVRFSMIALRPKLCPHFSFLTYLWLPSTPSTSTAAPPVAISPSRPSRWSYLRFLTIGLKVEKIWVEWTFFSLGVMLVVWFQFPVEIIEFSNQFPPTKKSWKSIMDLRTGERDGEKWTDIFPNKKTPVYMRNEMRLRAIGLVDFAGWSGLVWSGVLLHSHVFFGRACMGSMRQTRLWCASSSLSLLLDFPLARCKAVIGKSVAPADLRIRPTTRTMGTEKKVESSSSITSRAIAYHL